MRYTEEQFDKIGHALGIKVYNAKVSEYKKDKYLPETFYRNHYNYGIEGAKKPDFLIGLDNYVDYWDQFGCEYFQINDKGIELFRKQFYEEITSKFKPISKSKERYQQFILSEYEGSFAEYLGIIPPKIEYYKDAFYLVDDIETNFTEKEKEKLKRYKSILYENVAGKYKLTYKEAKESYKKALSIHKKYLKDLSNI